MARSEIPMVINLRQNKIADYQMCVQSVLSLPLQSEHCKVVALFHVAYKVGYSLRHPFDERAGGATIGALCPALQYRKCPVSRLSTPAKKVTNIDMLFSRIIISFMWLTIRTGSDSLSDHTLCDGVGLLPDGLEEIVTQDALLVGMCDVVAFAAYDEGMNLPFFVALIFLGQCQHQRNNDATRESLGKGMHFLMLMMKCFSCQDSPSISPLTMVMRSAWGLLGSPGMRSMSPAMATIISLPQLSMTSRMRMVKPSGEP